MTADARPILGPDHESVWDYPRPPRVEPVPERIRVVVGGVTVADTVHAKRVLETSHPPVYYIPRVDVRDDLLRPSSRRSACEFKGAATYHAIEVDGRRVEDVAWSYEEPLAGFEVIRGHLAFYAGRVDAAFVGDEQVQAQDGDFYGGWITRRIVGPFKGAPGTRGW